MLKDVYSKTFNFWCIYLVFTIIFLLAVYWSETNHNNSLTFMQKNNFKPSLGTKINTLNYTSIHYNKSRMRTFLRTALLNPSLYW